MRRLSTMALICLGLVALWGCKPATDLPTLQREQQERDQLKSLENELGEAKAELERLREREVERRVAELGVPTARELLTDLGAASALLRDARSHISSGDTGQAVALLRRADDIVSSLTARVPRVQIAVRLARADAALSAAGPSESLSDDAWETAREHVQEADTICDGSRSRPMHVNVEASLQTVLKALDEGKAQQAHEAIGGLLRTELEPSEDEAALGRAAWCISAAIDALGRRAPSAAAGWAADAEREVGTIVNALGGSEQAEGETQAPGAGAAAQPPASTKPSRAPDVEPEKPGAAGASTGTEAGTESGGTGQGARTVPPAAPE